jgi:CRISPR/Cas system CSM-associated protein Csm2 small subunit
MTHGDLSIYEKLLRSIRERKKAVEEVLCYGPIADYTIFREQRARLRELEQMEQELKDLLNRMENND